MADDARQPLLDLAADEALGVHKPLPAHVDLAESFDFFELLRRLESEGALFGHPGLPEREPARLGQHLRLAFATKDVAAFSPSSETAPARVTIANLGLLGPEGPLPLHITRWVLDRMSQRWFAGAEQRQTSDTTFIDFLNILQHRMMALFYRAWADATPAVQVERPVGGRVHAMLGAMAGIGMPGAGDIDSPELDAVRLRQAAALASQVDGPERLTLFLADAFKAPVRLREFVAAWLTVPANLQTQLGKAHATLGKGATIGPRTFGRQSRIEVEFGPVDLLTYKSFLPGSKRFDTLRRAIRSLTGEALDVDLRIVLSRDEVPAARIGHAQLGRTAWLAPAGEREDARDMRLRTVVGWRAETAGAGA
ncbi:type VI secretion system baseplate subunit TssG [Mesorhizobium sp. BR1-1-16]|uniref:type VI secretion system baseplate subunit TssG n=1 Tax=Mesorhizobium sp. BR1-1-16 TaxID=2876653 RepID=UPI001CCBFFF3|nr:type VI secretion system baseplate subunit TssG [Mesorhizobium sp. BR1-1-16]MBZ9936344.1 type VI secretion system baseplate subunit TssG [Mesorhizobium sp. BR1-1-16]